MSRSADSTSTASALAAHGRESLDESINRASENAIETTLGWLATYLPTWGTSLTLHAAVILMAALAVVALPKPAPVYVYSSKFVHDVKVTVERRPKPEGLTSTGRLKPVESYVAPPSEKPIAPSAGALHKPYDQLPPIGTGGSPRGGSPIGLTSIGKPPLFPPDEGGGETARRIVYVVDRSGSMGDAFDYVKMELKESLMELGPDREFHIIFYSSGPPVELPTRRLVHATQRNLQLAFEFIDNVVTGGETDPSRALERAFAAQPEIIYLLTDGEFDRAIIDQVRRLNARGEVRVHTIAFLYDTGKDVLEPIARQNGGAYKFVERRDLW